jgi:hypothetical protein
VLFSSLSNTATAVAATFSFAFEDAEYTLDLARVGTCICEAWGKLNSMLNRLLDGF